MELVEKIKKSQLLSHAKTFPRMHLGVIGALIVGLGLMSVIPTNQASVARDVTILELPVADAHADTNKTERDDVLTDKEIELKTITLTVKPNDNLSLLFKRAGMSDREMMNFLGAAEQPKRLHSMKPGHELHFHLNSENHIEKLTYVSSALASYSYINTDGKYLFSETLREPDIHNASRSGHIKSSLYSAGINAGMDEKLIMELAEIFGWDIDFALDMRSGDSFKILYEEHFLDGEKLGNGVILSAEFVNQGQRFQAVRYVHADGRAEYYTPDGKNMRKAFLRAPLDFRRISSNFNPRRLHPITKTVRPHRGIDYAARTGTPVWSSGDGRVIASGYTKANGNYVVIQHGNNVQTKYLHLHKRKVKRGQKVRQKQIIGTVGSTGFSTGPHLHYEFLLNGVHRNPRTIVQKLPKAESISPELKSDFLNQTQILLAELERETNTPALALKERFPSASAL